jgi:hypothetical protein
MWKTLSTPQIWGALQARIGIFGGMPPERVGDNLCGDSEPMPSDVHCLRKYAGQ